MLRPVTSNDIPALATLMPLSLANLGQAHYDEQTLAKMVRYIAIPDPVIIGDGSYYLVESEGKPVACGGWSRRKKLYTGSTEEEDAAEIWANPKTDPAKIRAFFVHPHHTRKGLGRAILTACEQAAQQEGFQRAELMALLPGVPLYRLRTRRRRRNHPPRPNPRPLRQDAETPLTGTDWDRRHSCRPSGAPENQIPYKGQK